MCPCNDCVYLDNSLDSDPCASCFFPVGEWSEFFPRRCATCQFNKVSPEDQPCCECMQNFNEGLGHSEWEKDSETTDQTPAGTEGDNSETMQAQCQTA